MNGESFNGLGSFMRAKAGIFTVFAVLSAGIFAGLWLTGIISLPKTFKAHEEVPHTLLTAQIDSLKSYTRANRDSILMDSWRLLYVICTQVPDATRQEKRLLRVNCGDLENEPAP